VEQLIFDEIIFQAIFSYVSYLTVPRTKARPEPLWEICGIQGQTPRHKRGWTPKNPRGAERRMPCIRERAAEWC